MMRTMTVRELIVALEAIAAEQGDNALVYYDDPARPALPIHVQAGWSRACRSGAVRVDAPRWLAEANAILENDSDSVTPCVLIEVPDVDRTQPRIRLVWLTMGGLKWRGRKSRTRGPWWPLSRKATGW